MKPFYDLRGPEAPPDLPDHWSFSGLAEWQDCPKRWWLLRARYPNAPTPYPQVASVAAMKGRIIHHALEKFTEHILLPARSGPIDYPKLRAVFPVRRVIRDYLASELGTELSTNPRVDASRILAQVSLDDCVNAFKEAAASSLRGLIGGRPSLIERGRSAKRAMGAEMWFETEDPRLCGRPDLVLSGAVYDFKTGDPDPKHVDQLQFYALLFWLETDTPPSSLTLVYTKLAEIRDVEVPTPPSLATLRTRYAQEIQTIETVHRRGNPAARPDVETCRYCPVRHLCDEYWASVATQPLRLGVEALDEAHADGTLWLDVDLEDMTATDASNGFVGYAQVAGVGSVRVSIAPTHCNASHRTRARILGGSVQHAESGLSVRVAGSTEVFWM
jgi:CRISPR/Cas system-associated exonuclease Cas4 (RecB family)